MAMSDTVTPVFGSAGPAVAKGIDLDEMFSEFFAFSDGEDTTKPIAGGTTRDPSSNDSASGEPFDVEGFGGGIEELDVGVDPAVGAGEEKIFSAASMSDTSAGTTAAGRGSRGISIGIGVAAGAASANQHRGLKRELSESNIAGGTMGSMSGKHGSIYGTMGSMSGRSMSEQQKLERRQERNREHAKRSRIRKKFMLECLQEQLLAMRKQNLALRQVVKEHMPDEAAKVFEKCTNEKALVLSGKNTESAQPIQSDEEDETKEPNCLLLEPDFQLMRALMESQQNFTISDPSMPDNPIVYASQGFLKLTGYCIQNVIGRNCRFLQGPGTDPRAIDIVRRGVAEGRDTSVCLLNYKADGTPFWNQFFVAALRDDTGKIVNYVGVQCEVQEEAEDGEFRERLRKIPLPEELMKDGNDDDDGWER
uniref:Putative LOV domain-containing protein n=1 Tax=Sargassum hemiphyllum TaxID=127544 RepID=A0A126X320_SARHM|nr:putative LOV domain-containing protein [Sargassum hemiphyllum]